MICSETTDKLFVYSQKNNNPNHAHKCDAKTSATLFEKYVTVDTSFVSDLLHKSEEFHE